MTSALSMCLLIVGAASLGVAAQGGVATQTKNPFNRPGSTNSVGPGPSNTKPSPTSSSSSQQPQQQQPQPQPPQSQPPQSQPPQSQPPQSQPPQSQPPPTTTTSAGSPQLPPSSNKPDPAGGLQNPSPTNGPVYPGYDPSAQDSDFDQTSSGDGYDGYDDLPDIFRQWRHIFEGDQDPIVSIFNALRQNAGFGSGGRGMPGPALSF